mgnify:CR=1 FL=1
MIPKVSIGKVEVKTSLLAVSDETKMDCGLGNIKHLRKVHNKLFQSVEIIRFCAGRRVHNNANIVGSFANWNYKKKFRWCSLLYDAIKVMIIISKDL